MGGINYQQNIQKWVVYYCYSHIKPSQQGPYHLPFHNMTHLELIARCQNHAPALRHGFVGPVGLPEDVEASPTNEELD